jgi:8-oxo-dGTP diphosphatase
MIMSMDHNLVARVGVGVFIFKDRKFLMGRRKGSHGSGTWSIPGGHLEFGESFEATAKREVKEETDLDITNVRFGAVTNDFFPEENKHYITIWVLSDYASGAARITEPDKFIEQEWHSFDDLPSPLFLPWKQLLKSEFIEAIRRNT